MGPLDRPRGRPVETCTILTTDANELLRPLHTRMPVIVDRPIMRLGSIPDFYRPERFRPLFSSLTASQLVMSPVSTLVNSPANEDEGCIAPVEERKLLWE